MEKRKPLLKHKNTKIILGLVVIAMTIAFIFATYVYSENQRKEKILNAMTITFDAEKSQIEYGSELEVKDLIKESNGGEIKDYPNLDTKKVGETTLTFVLEKSDLTKNFNFKVIVADSKAPEITFASDSKELSVNDEFDIKSNITSVKDIVDGDIAENVDAEKINTEATKQYNELKKENINDDTKVVDKKINEFLIETVKSEDQKVETTTLFLKNCYYVSGNVDTTTVGEYPIKVVAVDTNGIKCEKEYIISVKAKEVKQPASNINGNSSRGGVAAAEVKGKEWMVSYANSMVGQTGWNCQDFMDNALRQAGYLSASAPNFAYEGYDIAWTELTLGDVIGVQYVTGEKHGLIITSAPTIDANGNYIWSTVEGGLNANREVKNRTFTYGPTSDIQLLYVKRY